MTKAETIFQKELNQIHSPEIKDFVITCFDKLCPDYFWTCPCSTTGKYHPQVSLGVGGLVRHTKLAVWWGLELIKALHDSPELKSIALHTLQDEIIATLLLHDMVKNGKGLNAQGYPLDRGVTGTHGMVLADKISAIIPDELKGSSYERIIDGIAGHMGIWTTDTGHIILFKAFANLIHLADYCASRKVDNIYSKLEQEKTYGLNKQTTNENKISKSPACPGVRETESRETATAENGQ